MFANIGGKFWKEYLSALSHFFIYVIYKGI